MATSLKADAVAQDPVQAAVLANVAGSLSKSKAKPVHCDVCNMEMSSELTAESHFVGKTHKKRVARQEQLEKLKQCATLPTGKDVSNLLYCALCDLQLNSPEQMEQHMIGAKHQKSVKKGSAATKPYSRPPGQESFKRPAFRGASTASAPGRRGRRGGTVGGGNPRPANTQFVSGGFFEPFGAGARPPLSTSTAPSGHAAAAGPRQITMPVTPYAHQRHPYAAPAAPPPPAPPQQPPQMEHYHYQPQAPNSGFHAQLQQRSNYPTYHMAS